MSNFIVNIQKFKLEYCKSLPVAEQHEEEYKANQAKTNNNTREGREPHHHSLRQRAAGLLLVCSEEQDESQPAAEVEAPQHGFQHLKRRIAEGD